MSLNKITDDNITNQIKSSNYRFIITGSSGWLGRSLLQVLKEILQDEFTSRVFAISTSSSEITIPKIGKIKTYDYNHNFEKFDNIILFHLAFLTKEKTETLTDNDYISKNLKIRKSVINIINTLQPKALFYSSSGAIYNNNNLYSDLKIKDEIFFKQIAADNNMDLIIPRIFNIGGPNINKYNLYAISDMIIQAKNNGFININANFPVIRSYIHVMDLIKISFSWILDSNKKEKNITFDTANTRSLEIEDLAILIFKTLNLPQNIKRKKIDDKLPENRYIGDPTIQNKILKNYNINLQDNNKIIEDTYIYLDKLGVFSEK